MCGCSKDCLIFIPFRLPQISCFTLSLQCFSSDWDSCPAVGIRPLLLFPHLLRAGPVLLTLLFFPLVPSSYWALRGFFMFFSAGQVLLSTLSWCSVCASVSEVKYSWCIRGDRGSPRPLSPLPSSSPTTILWTMVSLEESLANFSRIYSIMRKKKVLFSKL